METIDHPDIISADDLFDGPPATVAGELRTAAGVLKQVSSPAPAEPTTVAVAAPTMPDKAKALSVKETVIALFEEQRPDLVALAERYRAVAYDVKTPKGMKEALAARHDLRENGRFKVQRARDAIKKQLNDGKKTAEDTAETLIAITKPTEDLLDGQITTREAEIEAEKAEAARLEALAVEENNARCAKLTATIKLAEGKTSAQLGNAIAHIEQLAITLERWGNRADFVKAGEGAKESTLAALRRMQIDAKTAEDNAALKAENERLAAENARLAAEQAELQRIADEAAAAVQRAAQEAASAADALAAEEAKAAEVARLLQETAAAPPAPIVAAQTGEEVDRLGTAMQEVATDERLAASAAAPSPAKWEPRFRAPAATTQAPAPTLPAHIEAALDVDFPDTTPLDALLAHLRLELNGKFASYPKPSQKWWADLRRLVDEVVS